MRYQRIVLLGYNRMRLNGHWHFEMRLDSPLQLILGTNGSGKSSLLWELSPLPASDKDFDAGGSKLVELTHRARQYVLCSSFAAKHTHSFICDGEELNKGHTITVQKELVKEHFGITQEIHGLLTGQESFVSMNAAKRKDWFLRLCDINYDYALRVFSQLKNAHRDRVGAIRLEKKALVVESQKLLSDQDIEKIDQETQWLHECLSHLLEWRKPVESDLELLELESRKLDKQLISQANQLSSLQQRLYDRVHTDAELMELEAEAMQQMTAAQTRMQMLTQQHEAVSKKIAVLQQAGQSTIGSLEQQIAELMEMIASQPKSLVTLTDTPERAHAAFEAVKAGLLEIFQNIPNNADTRYSSAALQQTREKLAAQHLLKNNTLQWLAENKASLAHMRDHMGKPDVTCPKCSHAFSLVYSEQRMLALSKKIAEKQEELETEIDPTLAQLESFAEECQRYGTLYRQFVYATQSASACSAYWQWLNERRTLTDNPAQGASDLQRIEQDLGRQLLLGHQRAKLAQYQQSLQQLISVGEADLGQLQAESQQLQDQLAEQTNLLQSAQTAHAGYRAQLALRGQMAGVRKSIRKAISQHRQLLQQNVEHHRRTILNKLIRQLQSALASREQALFTARRQKEVVDQMTRKIEQLAKEEQALEVLVKELSPTEGLIAEGMLGFIKNYCDSMNDLISKVWSYPLVIQSCDLVEGESIDLDYLFPMKVGEEEFVVSDVLKGSEGMREIINLAFRITAMQYLDLQDYPLYLDEVGRTFDKEHRNAAAMMIRSLIEQSSFSQIFMISHYENLYGALAGAQVCVLNPNNITTPESYNQHVIAKD